MKITQFFFAVRNTCIYSTKNWLVLQTFIGTVLAKMLFSAADTDCIFSQVLGNFPSEDVPVKLFSFGSYFFKVLCLENLIDLNVSGYRCDCIKQN